MSDAPRTDVGELSFDEALERLEKAAEQLEAGDVPLEDALRVYERSVRLFRHCNERLAHVEQRLELLTRDLDGGPVATRLEDDEDDG